MTSPETGAPTTEGVNRIGTVISGRYLVQKLLGEGGMGAVYLAEHTHMKKRVALKLLHPEMSNNVEVSARFEREAMASAHVEHPNVAAATDFGKTEDGAFFLVLEYVEGTNLRDALAKGPLSVTRALRIGRQMALALERAHDAGIVHRDLKPENIMLVSRGDEPDFVKVLDFGIAKVLELGAAGASEAMARRSKGGQPLTRIGTILGTPEYMAPEQALGEAVTPAADLYAVGILLYEMLTGVHPFSPPDRMAMLSFHIVAPVPLMMDRAPQVEVPATVEAVVRCLLEKDAKKRYANARALVEAIDSAAATSGLEVTTAATQAQESMGRGGVAAIASASPSQPRLVAGEVPRGPDSTGADAFAKTTHGTPPPNVVTGASPGSPPLPGAGATAPLTTGAGSATTGLLASLKRQPQGVIIALAAAVPLGLILIVVLLVLAFRAPKAPTHRASSSGSGGESAEAKKAKTAPPDRVKGAVALGPEAIEALVKEFPEDTALLSRLAVAQHAQGRSADALRTVRTLLAADPKAASDDEVVQLVATMAARGKPEDDDEAFALLEGPLGERGVDALIELGAKGGGRELRELRARAARSLARPEVRAHASPPALVLLDLKAAQTCPVKHDLLTRVKEQGDARVLPVLRSLKLGRGCGFLGRGDCWPCLRKDAALEEAIAAVEARPGPR